MKRMEPTTPCGRRSIGRADVVRLLARLPPEEAAMLIKDGIAAFTWDEIKATTEINFPNYGHALFSTEEFIATIQHA